MQIQADKKNISINEVEKEMTKSLPMGKFQDSSNLGSLVAFLCSEHAASITGTTIPIDGGLSKSLL